MQTVTSVKLFMANATILSLKKLNDTLHNEGVIRVGAKTTLTYFIGPSFISFKNRPDRGGVVIQQYRY